jgi:hypothetical protein
MKDIATEILKVARTLLARDFEIDTQEDEGSIVYQIDFDKGISQDDAEKRLKRIESKLKRELKRAGWELDRIDVKTSRHGEVFAEVGVVMAEDDGYSVNRVESGLTSIMWSI